MDDTRYNKNDLNERVTQWITDDVKKHATGEGYLSDGITTAVKLMYRIDNVRFLAVGIATLGSDDVYSQCTGVRIAQKRAERKIVKTVVEYICRQDAVDILMMLSRVAYNEVEN